MEKFRFGLVSWSWPRPVAGQVKAPDLQQSIVMEGRRRPRAHNHTTAHTHTQAVVPDGGGRGGDFHVRRLEGAKVLRRLDSVRRLGADDPCTPPSPVVQVPSLDGAEAGRGGDLQIRRLDGTFFPRGIGSMQGVGPLGPYTLPPPTRHVPKVAVARGIVPIRGR